MNARGLSKAASAAKRGLHLRIEASDYDSGRGVNEGRARPKTPDFAGADRGSFRIDRRGTRLEDVSSDGIGLVVKSGCRVFRAFTGFGMLLDTKKTVLLIAGMRDNRCRELVSESLEQLDGVHQVSVDLFQAKAVIVHEPSVDARDLVHAVEAVGYRAAFVPGTGNLGAPIEVPRTERDPGV